MLDAMQTDEVSSLPRLTLHFKEKENVSAGPASLHSKEEEE
jgi:hypothetical protein